MMRATTMMLAGLAAAARTTAAEVGRMLEAAAGGGRVARALVVMLGLVVARVGAWGGAGAVAVQPEAAPVAGAEAVAVLRATPAPGPVELDCTPDRFPALVPDGDDIARYANRAPAGFRGFADPCLRADPDGRTLWLAYSWPHVERRGGGPRDYAIGVSTHLATSRDGGRTWRRQADLWPRTPVTWRDGKSGAAIAGALSHEVPNLVAITIDGRPAWVGARLDYFLPDDGGFKGRDPRSFCLRVMTAPTPPELRDAPHATLGHAFSAAECRVDVILSRISPDFPPAFIPNEPALHVRGGRLWLAFVVMVFEGRTPQPARSFIAVLSTVPAGEVRSWHWRYHGRLATPADAAELGGEALTQIELAVGRDGRLLAFLTPEAWDPVAGAGEPGEDPFFGIVHRGCVVVEVADLERPALARRPDGTLAVRARLTSSTQSRQGPGAAGYDPASATGILFTLRDLSSPRDLSWSLHPTRLHP